MKTDARKTSLTYTHFDRIDPHIIMHIAKLLKVFQTKKITWFGTLSLVV